MGQFNNRASRRVEDAMTADVVDRLGVKATALMAAHLW
jgi:hypothetical protein